MKKLEEGTELYSVATGRILIWEKASRDAVRFIQKQKGFVAIAPVDYYGERGFVAIAPVDYYGGMLWLFDSLNNAKRARNMMKLKGIGTGNNICRFTYENKQLVFDEEYAKREGLNG